MPELEYILRANYEGVKSYYRQIKDTAYRLVVSDITIKHLIIYYKK
jgi:hypothetical protein